MLLKCPVTKFNKRFWPILSTNTPVIQIFFYIWLIPLFNIDIIASIEILHHTQARALMARI